MKMKVNMYPNKPEELLCLNYVTWAWAAESRKHWLLVSASRAVYELMAVERLAIYRIP